MKRSSTPQNCHAVAASTLDELLVEPLATIPTAGLVAEVIDDRHPSLVGRVAVQWSHNTASIEKWVPTVSGLAVRRGDRVLLQQPANWPEPVVTGVLDGYQPRQSPPLAERARLELRPDETVRLCDHRGSALVQIHQGEHGPVVELCADNLELRVPGHLKLSAESLRITARSGSATLDAADDVIVRGETVHLN